MHKESGIARRLLLWSTMPLLLTLAACGGSKANSTPTLSVEEIFTSAAQTFEAQQATELALTPPTDTPLPPSPFPTLPPASPAGPLPTISFTSPTVSSDSVPGCDNATYIADLTIPDGTRLEPSQNFTKKWRIQNTGSCTWDSTYQLSFVDGEHMNGPANVNLALSVPPGQQADVAVNLQALSTPGDFYGRWQMQNPKGAKFGSILTVVIKVGQPQPTATP
jgi:hypothetical protein